MFSSSGRGAAPGTDPLARAAPYDALPAPARPMVRETLAVFGRALGQFSCGWIVEGEAERFLLGCFATVDDGDNIGGPRCGGTWQAGTRERRHILAL